jgi:hypothetical protein
MVALFFPMILLDFVRREIPSHVAMAALLAVVGIGATTIIAD